MYYHKKTKKLIPVPEQQSDERYFKCHKNCSNYHTGKFTICRGPCKRRFHHDCIGLTEDMIDLVQWECDHCIFQKPEEPPLTGKEREELVKDFLASLKYFNPQKIYEIERILDHRKNIMTNQYEYLVRWACYPEEQDSWEPEFQITTAFEKLEEYIKEDSLGEPAAERKSTNMNPVNINMDNWRTSSERFLTTVRGHLQKEYRQIIEIEILERGQRFDNRKDKIFIFEAHNRLFAGMYLNWKRKIYLGDGTNSYFEDKQTRASIRNWFHEMGITIKAFRYSHQSHPDHSPSSAAVIAIKLAQMYGGKVKPNGLLVAPRTITEKLTKIFHKHTSANVQSSMKRGHQIDNITIYRCPYKECDFRTKKRDQRAMNGHIRSHHKRKNE